MTLDDWVMQFPGLQAASRALWKAIRWEFEEQEPPMTVRQVFYRMSSGGHVGKTEGGYRRVQYALLKMRRAGAIPYDWIADNTRWVRKGASYGSMSEALNVWHRNYRRDLWAMQPAYVEVWLEKDALAGVLFDITDEFDVPLYVTRGYSSETFLYEAAQSLMAINKPIHIYHFGDYDPSGRDAARDIAAKLRGFGAEFEFVEAAVTAWQINHWELPERPTKRRDTRAKNWQGGSVELDAIPPAKLRGLVRACIEDHIDWAALEHVRLVESEERARILEFASFGASPKTGAA